MMFDRELCCKQLRYSGMMETIRIRRAGYPIRHTFFEFVERYRFLISGIEPAHKQEDCRVTTRLICKEVLKNADYQLGDTKVFLKDAHDLFLEQERDKVLTKRIVTLQKYIRGWYYRKRFVQKRKAAVIIQKCWRLYAARRNYLIMKNGFLRLQALIQSRTLTNQFKHLRRHLVSLQSICRGYLTRKELKIKTYAAIIIQSTIRGFIARKRFVRLKQEYLRLKEIEEERLIEEINLARKMNANEAKKLAQMNYNERIKQLENKHIQEQLAEKKIIAEKNALIEKIENINEEELDDSKLVDAMFNFLPGNESQTNTIGRSSGLVSNGLMMNGMSNKVPTAFEDLNNKKQQAGVVDDKDQFIDDDLDLSSTDNEEDPMYNNNLDPTRTNHNNNLFGEEIEDLSLYKFQKFAATYFQGNANDKFSKKPLQRSLLTLPSQADSMAAVALSLTILRFMGDCPEPNYNSKQKDNTSVMTKVTATLGRNFIKSKEFMDAQMHHQMENNEKNGFHIGVNGYNGMNGSTNSIKPKKSIRTKLVSLTLKKKNKFSEDVRKRLQDEDIAADTYSNWLDSRPTSNLEVISNSINTFDKFFNSIIFYFNLETSLYNWSWYIKRRA